MLCAALTLADINVSDRGHSRAADGNNIFIDRNCCGLTQKVAKKHTD